MREEAAVEDRKMVLNLSVGPPDVINCAKFCVDQIISFCGTAVQSLGFSLETPHGRYNIAKRYRAGM